MAKIAEKRAWEDLEKWAAEHGDTAGPVRRGAEFVIELLDGAVWVVPTARPSQGIAKTGYRVTVAGNDRLEIPDRAAVDRRGREDETVRRRVHLGATLDGLEELDLFFEALTTRYDTMRIHPSAGLDEAPAGANSVTVGARAPRRWLIVNHLRMSSLVDLFAQDVSFAEGPTAERVAAVGEAIMATPDHEVDIDATGLGLPFAQELAARFPEIVQHHLPMQRTSR